MKKSKHNLIFSFLILVIMISLTSCAHVHSRDEGSWVVDMEPTCTKTGTKQLVCSCGVILETDVVPARGHEFTDGVCQICDGNASIGLEYTLNPDKETYCVSGLGTCTETDIVIPETYYGKLVTHISERAFYGCNIITSIEIPNSVKAISAYTFHSCDALTSVKLGNEVISIGRDAFSACDSLASIDMPDSLKRIGEQAFAGCGSLTSVKIGSGVTSIGDSAFEYCSGLTDITFNGTMEQWDSISKGSSWNSYIGDYTIHCTDGDLIKND